MRKIILTLSFFLLLFSSSSYSKTTTSTGGGGGLWAGLTWNNGAPVAGDDVILNHAALIFGNTLDFNSLTINDVSLTYFSGSLTVGDLTITSTGTSAGLSVGGSSLTLTVTGNITFTSGDPNNVQLTLNQTGTILNLGGGFVNRSQGTISAAGACTLNLTGSSSGSIFGSNTGNDWGNITINKSGGTITLGESIVNNAGNLTFTAGTLDCSTFSLNGSGSATVAAACSLLVGEISTTPLPVFTGGLTLNSDAYIEYNGTGNQTIISKSYNNLVVSGSGIKTVASGTTVSGIVTVNGTAALACGTGNLTILSTSSGTAAIGQVASGASVTGSPTIQRYVSDMSAAGNPGWWYFLGAPVSGQTIANIDDEITTTGFTGSDFPSSSFVSMSRWNGSAYVNATNTTDNMNIGEGWFVYMGSNTPAYDIPATISWTGGVTTGDYSGFSISSTALEYTSLSNPYPSAVTFDLTSMPNSNVQNPYVVNNDGTFLALTNGSTLGLAQGFYIETASNGAASLTFGESDKLGSVEGNSVFNKSSKSIKAIKPRLTAEITKVNGEVDFSYLELDDTKTLGMDYPADFDKYDNFIGYTNIFFKHNGHKVHINHIPTNIGSGVSIPIHLSRAYPNGSNVTLPIRINGVEDFRKEGICLTLEETATGNMTTLLNDFSNTIVWNDNDTAAVYVLHLSKAFDEASTDATCYGFEDGSASANAFVTAKYDFYLTNLIGDTLQSEMGKVANSHTFNNVKAGKYNLLVNDPNGCGLLAKPVEVTEPDPVLSFFTTPKNNVDLSVNPEIKFSNHSANAQSYLWQFGDGNSSIDFEPIHEYTAIGNYKVNLIAYNGACTDTSTKSVLVENNSVGIYEIEENKNLQLFQANEKIELRFNLNQRELINARLVNVLGQEVWSSQGKTIQNEQLTFNLPEENTFYLLTIKGESFETNYKLVRK